MAEKNLTLKCGACGHENEPERVYCHNCGQKLDRSMLPAPEAGKQKEDDADKHRRVKKMMQVGATGGWFLRDVKTAVKVLIFAAVVAALFLFWQKPDGLPVVDPEELPERSLAEAWEQLMEIKEERKLAFAESEANIFLKRSLKPAAAAVPGVTFERAMVNFHAGPDGAPGTITVTAERNAWGLPLFSSVTLAPRERDGKVEFDVIGIRFGRLSIHPSMKFLSDAAMGSVKKVFEKEIGQASRLKAARPGDKVIVFETNIAP